MRILGIDPGYAIMGWGVLEYQGNRFQTIAYGSLETDAGIPMPMRLKEIYDGLSEIIRLYQPTEAAIEELFFHRNTTTVIGVGEARGIAMLACVEGGLTVSEYTPMQIKQALVGYGKADKKQVQEMVRTILHLDKVPKPDDTADAIAAAICHAHSRKHSAYGSSGLVDQGAGDVRGRREREEGVLSENRSMGTGQRNLRRLLSKERMNGRKR